MPVNVLLLNKALILKHSLNVVHEAYLEVWTPVVLTHHAKKGIEEYFLKWSLISSDHNYLTIYQLSRPFN